jgi:hypothetical protein
MGSRFDAEEMEKLVARKLDPHSIGNGTHKPFECDDVCVDPGDGKGEAGGWSDWDIDLENLPPGCTCKENANGEKDCRFRCGDDLDPLYAGMHMDQCGLPIKTTRCPGFKRGISCEEEFRTQWAELEDFEHNRVMIDLKPYCQKCRETTVLHRRKVELVVEVEEVSPLVRRATAYDPVTERYIPVDALWLFIAGLEFTPNSLHQFHSGDKWPLEIISYSLPRIGLWDEEPYTTTDLGRTAAIANHLSGGDKSLHLNGTRQYISVALVANDPRLKDFDQMEIFAQSALNLNANKHGLPEWGRWGPLEGSVRYGAYNYTQLELSDMNRTIT